MAHPLGLQPQRLLVTASPRSPGEVGPVWRVGRRCRTRSPHTQWPQSLIGWQDSQAQGWLWPPWAVSMLSVPLHAEAGRSRTLSVHAEEDVREPPMLRGTAGKDRSRTGSVKCPTCPCSEPPVVLSGASTRGADSGKVVHGDVHQQDQDQEGAGGGSLGGGEGEARGQEAQVGRTVLAAGRGPATSGVCMCRPARASSAARRGSTRHHPASWRPRGGAASNATQPPPRP